MLLLLRVIIKADTQTSNTVIEILSHSGNGLLHITARESAIIERATTFVELAIDLFLSQSRNGFPNIGWLYNQWWAFGELFKKHHADSNRNGVVGSTGRNAPIIPSAREMNPIENKVVLITEFLTTDTQTLAIAIRQHKIKFIC